MYLLSAAEYDAIYSAKKDYRREAQTIDALIRARNPGARTLLDVACGTGLHLEHLREHFDAQGLDLNAAFAAAARQRNPGVTIHEGDMRTFDLGRTFDAVTCLFSSIGYVRSALELESAIANLARHVADGGVLVVEPWFGPDQFRGGHLARNFVDTETIKLARMCKAEVHGRMAVMDMHHLVGDETGVRHFIEHHEMFLASDDEYATAFTHAGLAPTLLPTGLNDRGVWVATRRV